MVNGGGARFFIILVFKQINKQKIVQDECEYKDNYLNKEQNMIFNFIKERQEGYQGKKNKELISYDLLYFSHG